MRERLKQSIVIAGKDRPEDEERYVEEVVEKVVTLMDILRAMEWIEEESTLVALGMLGRVLEVAQGKKTPNVTAVNFEGRSPEEVRRIYEEGGSL